MTCQPGQPSSTVSSSSAKPPGEPRNRKPSRNAIVNGQIFTGETLLEDQAVVFEDGKVLAVLPSGELPQGMPIDFDLQGGCLAPGFIDLQVNGGGGRLFNDAPSVETLRIMGEAHRRGGTTGFLPTLISDGFPVMRKAIAAVSQAIAEGVPGVLGIHLEGPFLNPEKRGIHDAGKFRPLDEEGFELVSSLRQGKTLLTLAPEMTSPAMIRRLADAGLVVCAGHSACTYAQARSALEAGLAGFTHLFNAMTQLGSREPGLVGAALEDADSWFGLIADGHHVHPATLRIALAAKPPGGALLVTDAMPSLGAKRKSFLLNGERIEAAEGRCVNAAGRLAGADLDMISAVNNLIRFADLDWREALRMASLHPARALGLDHQLGRIRPGCAANFVALDAQRNLICTWMEGKRCL